MVLDHTENENEPKSSQPSAGYVQVPSEQQSEYPPKHMKFTENCRYDIGDVIGENISGLAKYQLLKNHWVTSNAFCFPFSEHNKKR